jgi:hypothetical protein
MVQCSIMQTTANTSNSGQADSHQGARCPYLLTCFVCHQVPCSNAQRPEHVLWHEAHPLHDGSCEGCIAFLKVSQQLFGPCTALGTVLSKELVNYQLTCGLVGVLEGCDGGVMPQTDCRTQGVWRLWPSMQAYGGIGHMRPTQILRVVNCTDSSTATKFGSATCRH